VQQGGAKVVMASYNRVNDHYSWANTHLLRDVLRKDWGFKGIVTSDWGCEWMLPQDRSVKESIEAGTNIHMPQGYYYGEPLIAAVKAGTVKESDVDKLVAEILVVVHELGLVGNKKKIDQSQCDTPAHHALARETAAQSIVLLKNDRAILPLNKNKIKTIAVIGPNANVAYLGDRASAFAPTSYKVSPLQGLKNKLGKTVAIKYEKGYDITAFTTVLKTALSTPDGKPGLFVEYFAGKDAEGAPAVSGIDASVKFAWGAKAPKDGLPDDKYAVAWSGKLSSKIDKTCFIGIKSSTASKVYIDGRLIIENAWSFEKAIDANEVKYARLDLKKTTPRDIRIEFFRGKEDASVELLWADVPRNPFAAAIAAAKSADYAIFFGGLNTDHEGEGLDRFDMNLPGLQDELIQAVVKANPRTIVVLNSGTPNDMSRWIAQVPAVLQSWYPGMEGGNAIADILFGDVNPSGRLPMTFAMRREDYADFPHSTVKNDEITYAESIFVGYRHFDAKKLKVLFPFGHGLSYTTFACSDLKITNGKDGKGVEVTVKNTGTVEGSEVVQLYVGDPVSSLPRPPKELKAFQKIKLKPGASEKVYFAVPRQALMFYDPAKSKWVLEPGKFEIMIGRSAGDIVLRQTIEMG
jgi:beta-glucosidase